MKTASISVLLAILLCVSWQNARAAQTSEDIVRVPTVTRLVKAFSQLEVEIIAAVKQKDQAKLAQLIDQNFEMQVASKSVDPVPLSEWLKASMEEGSSYTYDIADMAVHDLGQAAIVSFCWKNSAATKSLSPEAFIVDVWKKEGMDWKLAIRFVSTAQKSGEGLPGYSVTDGVIEKKY